MEKRKEMISLVAEQLTELICEAGDICEACNGTGRGIFSGDICIDCDGTGFVNGYGYGPDEPDPMWDGGDE